jgi:hypothetical protein
MMHYAETVKGSIAFPLQSLDDLYGDVIEKAHMTQVRLAETEKYPHVTFFFDGGKEMEFKHSTRIVIPSPNVATYDLKPEMSAYEVKDKAVEAIRSKAFDTMILNFANPDMVGHTGSLSATIKAVEAVDACTKEVVEALLKEGGIAIVLADHGNAEQMIDSEGNPHTAHTTNVVPVAITSFDYTLSSGALCDVAPTLLELLGIGGTRGAPGYGRYATAEFGADKFKADPGYAFRMSEGMKALERSAAARGGLLSGATLRGTQRFGQDLASQEYQNAFNRYQAERAGTLNPYQALAGTAQSGANVLGQQAGQMGSNISNALGAYGSSVQGNLIGAGNAQAAGQIGMANALAGGVGQGINFYQNQQLLSRLPSYGSSLGGGF